MTYDADFNPQPQLAESWEVSDDQLTLTFHLRDGVRWHDGTPFTSADVQYSATEAWKKLHSRGRITFANLESVETPDPLTVVFRLSKPSPILLSALGAAESLILPRHLYEGTDIKDNPHNLAPVGTGAFKVAEWKRGEHILLIRNEDYWDKGKPYLDRLIFRIIPDEAGRAAALETGEVLYAPYDPAPFADVARLRENPELVIENNGYDWQAQLHLIEFNLRNPILADLRVRQAIYHAIPRQELIDVALYGLGREATSPIIHNARYFKADLPSYPFDPVKAEALLDEAGHPRGADGIRFKLRIDRQVLPAYISSSEFLRQTLKRAGIEIEIQARDTAGALKAVYTDYDFDLNNLIISSYKEPQMGLLRLFYSKNAKPGVPYIVASGYQSAEADALIETISTETDPAERARLFGRLQEIILTDLPVAPLYEVQHYTAHNRGVKGVEANPDSGISSLKSIWLEG
ncbi:ABC transporter substrate-binding protein [Paenirhodobacter populi]|uniref:ABC transporter substrate-binding protein n=1 Tax=Paenirhodobacter populi TaxID=2306993 RepID=UPI0019D475E5|nr:ABC transporter substrate-binding protein [Sinirhodobacter populi]